MIQNENNGGAESGVVEKINKNWMEIFRKNKGIKHLITVIFQYEVSHFATNLGYSCLNEIVNFLKKFAKVGDEIKNENEEAGHGGSHL